MFKIKSWRLAVVLVLFFVTFGGAGHVANAGTLGFGNISSPPNTSFALVINNNAHTVSFNVGLTAVGFFDVEFEITDSGGTNNFAFTGDFANNTGIPWTDFHFLLGSGVATAFVPFTGATNEGIDFLASPTPTSNVFTILDQETDALSWSGGLVPNGGTASFTFSFPVPDGFDTTGNFVLRSFPTVAAVPEPSTMLLLGSGLLGLVGYGRKKFFKK